MSTDYDCWHESEEEVTMEMIFATMEKNVSHVKKLIEHSIQFIKSEFELGK
jgi:5'-methylthioadenosine phosphorylase